MPVGDPTSGTNEELVAEVKDLKRRVAELEKYGTLLLDDDGIVDLDALPVGTQLFRGNGHWEVKQPDGTWELKRDIWLARIPEPES